MHPVNTHTYFGEGARDYFIEARDAIVDQQEWLEDHELDSPFVSNTSASGGSYQVFMFAASYAVTHAVWFAGLSAIYTESDEAKAAADLGGEINTTLTQLGADSMGCYMRHGLCVAPHDLVGLREIVQSGEELRVVGAVSPRVDH